MRSKTDLPFKALHSRRSVTEAARFQFVRGLQGGGVVKDLRREDPTISDVNHLGKAFCEQKHQTSHD